MPRFAANLSMMFTEHPFLDRFAAAADAGFTAVEYLFPYEHAPAALAEFRLLVDEAPPVAETTHDAAVALAQEHGLDIYDALIIAAAIEAGCDTLYSEDLQTGRKFGPLTVVNPFA